MVSQKEKVIGRLQDKVAIVTGAAGGIGAATAKLFAREGASVIVADIDEAHGSEVAQEILRGGGKALFIRLDVSSEENWQALIDEVLKTHGKLNILVNNAGISHIAGVETTTLDGWNRTMAVNATGVFLGMKHAIQAMKDSGESCSIVNRSSIDGQVAEAEVFAYCASKGAVTVMTKSAALYCGAKGYKIRVNSVHPAYVHTNMTKGEARGYGISEEEYMRRMKAIHPIGIGTPEDVAHMDLFLASDESRWVTGAEFTIDGGVTAGIIG